MGLRPFFFLLLFYMGNTPSKVTHCASTSRATAVDLQRQTFRGQKDGLRKMFGLLPSPSTMK